MWMSGGWVSRFHGQGWSGLVAYSCLWTSAYLAITSACASGFSRSGPSKPLTLKKDLSPPREEDRPFTYSCSAKSYSQLDIDPITLFQDSQSLLIHPSNQVILSSPGSKISPREVWRQADRSITAAAGRFHSFRWKVASGSTGCEWEQIDSRTSCFQCTSCLIRCQLGGNHSFSRVATGLSISLGLQWFLLVLWVPF